MKRKLYPIDKLSQDTQRAFDITYEASDIACALVIAGFLDQALGALLQAHFVQSEVADKLLAPGAGVLSDFGTRARTAYVCGLISKQLFKNLLLIAEIRNTFAHSHLGIKFEDEGIPQFCDELVLPDVNVLDPLGSDADRTNEDIARMLVTPRMKFVINALLMADRILKAGRETQHRTRPKDGWISPPAA